MFYSHDILTSRQYGVATIWLVATIGNKTGGKRVSKKAIQEVDVQRACEKIIQPGAPIALRLQGSLLYGVSRVYNQQCSYMLTDAHKIQTKMIAFFNQFNTNQLDPDAGKARRENIMIMDDPDFFPIGPLPEPNPAMFVLSQNTNKTSSQMSPNSLPPGGSSSSVEQFPINLGLRHSSVSDSHASPHGLRGLSSAQKPAALDDGGGIFGMDEMAGPIDWGVEIDADGNIIEHPDPGLAIVQDELELPPLPTIEGAVNASQRVEQLQFDQQGDFIMIEEQPLPDAEALPERQRQEQPDPFASEERDNQQSVPAQRKRKVILADEETEVSRNVLRDWQHDYPQNCTTRKPRPVTATQARKNAILLTFGLGIAGVGQNLGVPGIIHPLAEQFSGDSLFTALTGLEVLEKGRGKRVQSATESIEDAQDGEQHKRPRLEEEGEERGRGLDMDDIFAHGQDALQGPPEIGREAQPALEDPHSSAMPWNRGSSQMPGSSIQGSVKPGRDQLTSPLGNHGSVQDIVRYSDDTAMGGLDDGGVDFGGGGDNLDLYSDNLPFDGIPPPAIPETPSQMKSDTRESLDHEGHNFLSFIEETIRENGELRCDEDFELHRRWVDFDDIFVPNKTDRMTAAQAFYHVLTLVTKGKMIVEQDGHDNEPFGGIHIGITVAPGA